jgi:aminoglycoside/choline kinase family phosphotransferase
LNSIIFLRDLGSQTTFCTHTTDITRERAENQLRLLATFHGRRIQV